MKKISLISILFLALIFPSKVQAASASFFTSGGGTVYPGANINVTVYANGSEAYNAVDFSVNFSNLTYVGVSVAGGWTGVSGPTRSGNTITFSGALLGSSTTGSKTVLNISFKAPNSPGTGTISASGKIALADGNGTQVSGGGNIVTYTIINPPAPPPPLDPPPQKPTITSTTHPSQDDWYTSKSVELSWNKEEGVNVFSHILDNKADTIPDDEAEGGETSIKINDLVEGINYFHLKAHNDVGWGETIHFRINLDTTAPDPFKIAKLNDSDNESLLIYFATNDSTSGISHFNVELDGVGMGKQLSGYEIPLDVGKVKVTAFDMAGNSISDELVINDLVPIESDLPKENPINIDVKTALVTLATVILIEIIIAGILLLVRKQLTARKKAL